MVANVCCRQRAAGARRERGRRAQVVRFGSVASLLRVVSRARMDRAARPSGSSRWLFGRLTFAATVIEMPVGVDSGWRCACNAELVEGGLWMVFRHSPAARDKCRRTTLPRVP
jgi:hypothetical protein